MSKSLIAVTIIRTASEEEPTEGSLVVSGSPFQRVGGVCVCVFGAGVHLDAGNRRSRNTRR